MSDLIILMCEIDLDIALQVSQHAPNRAGCALLSSRRGDALLGCFLSLFVLLPPPPKKPQTRDLVLSR